MTITKLTTRRHRSFHGLILLWSCVVSFSAGCVTPWEKSALLKESNPNIDHIQGPTQRSLRNFFKKKEEQDELADGTLKPIKGTPEYLAATEKFKDDKFASAEKEFKKVSKKYKKSEIREDALFMEAECAWQQEHYSRAHDVYAVLLKEYPSTRHLNVVSERLFKLGRMWLSFPEVAKLGEIQQVNFDDPNKPKPSDEPAKLPKKTPLFVPNFSDKKEPLFDTPGNGVAALTAVWMNDPTGPLADDAMMLVASYHARRGNYIEADRYFQNLRELYPNSPHVQNAFLLGAHVKLMSYQGPEYETRTLREAQLLKQSILKLYPDIPEADKIREDLAKVEEAKAEVLWSHAQFYQRKGNKEASSIYCHELITEFPKSQYVSLARAKLAELGPEYESGSALMTSRVKKKETFLERVLENPAPYRLRKYPMIGNPKPVASSASNSKNKSNESDSFSSGRKSPKGKSVEEPAESTQEEVSPTDTDSPEEQPEPPRRRGSFSRPPQRLPQEADASPSSSNTSGRARL